MTYAGVERLDHDLRGIPLVVVTGQREQDGAPTGQQLRTVSDLAGGNLDDVRGLAPVARHAPDPVRALPVENRIVGCPTRAPWVVRRTQHDRRATRNRDLLELSALPEADPVAVRREERTPSPRVARGRRERSAFSAANGLRLELIQRTHVKSLVRDIHEMGTGRRKCN